MIYLYYSSITPNTASGNRYLSFLRGFDDLGVEATAVLQSPGLSRYHIPSSYKHVKIMELWREWFVLEKVCDKFYTPLARRSFLKSLKKGDTVLVYGSPECVETFSRIPGVRVFHERTESPEVIPIANEKKQNTYLKSCAQIDGLFVISTALKDYFVSIGVSPDKIHIINMTVDVGRFANLLSSKKSQKFITYCGSASNNKDGIDILIKAFSLVSQRFPDVKLQIIGNAPNKNDASGNVKLVESLGLAHKVVFTGVISMHKMPQVLKDSTILVLARPDSLQAKTGFPTKLGEYLLSESPVVVTSVGDIPLFLEHGKNAMLSVNKSPQEIAFMIMWLLEHPIEAAAIGKEGAKVAMRCFNYLTEVKKIVRVLNTPR